MFVPLLCSIGAMHPKTSNCHHQSLSIRNKNPSNRRLHSLRDASFEFQSDTTCQTHCAYLGSEDVQDFFNLLTRLDKANPTGIPLVNDIDLTIVIVAEDVEIVIYVVKGKDSLLDGD